MNYINNYNNEYYDKRAIKLLELIGEDYKKMSEEELQNIGKKIIPINSIKKSIMSYEFINLKIKPIKMSLYECVKIGEKIINKYQCKAGGFDIEDEKWIMHKIDSEEYNVKENEILLENTICEYNFKNNETQKYLKKLLEIFNSIATNIVVTLDHIVLEEDDDISILLIWFVDKSKKID